MFQEDLQPHSDQNDAAGEFSLRFVFCPKDMTDLDAKGGEQEGRHANEADGGDDVNLQEGEGDANGEGINASRNGKKKHGLDVERIICLFFLLRQCLANHGDADEREQNKGNPVINRGNVGLKLFAEKEAEEWHASLKAAEPQADDGRLAYAQLSHGESLADGDGKGIHGEPDGDQE